MGLSPLNLNTEYESSLLKIMREIHKYGYRWDEQPHNVSDSQSLNDYIADGKLSSVLGRYWGCSTPNLYFYDRTEVDIEARIRWFHDAVAGALDLPWLRIRRKLEDHTFEYGRITENEKEDLRREQRHFLKEGPLSARIIFDMFGQRQFRRTLTEKEQGWVLVPLGEILVYTFEWRLRQTAERIHRRQAGRDLTEYFETEGRTELLEIWTDLMTEIGDSADPIQYFHGVMLAWLRDVILNKQGEYSDWWKKTDNPDWFIKLAKEGKWAEKLHGVDNAASIEGKLNVFTNIMITTWDYTFHNGHDCQWEPFLQRLRFSPPMEVEHFRTRNLVAFPTWLQWLHNGGKLISANAAFVFAGFYDADVARAYARDIQMLFVLLTALDIAKHTIPKLMLAKAGVLAEATTYELRQPLSSLTSLIDALENTLKEESKIRKDFGLPVLADMKRATGLIERVGRELLYLPGGDRPALEISSVDLNTLVEEALDLCNLAEGDNREGIKVKRDYAPNLPPVRADRDKLRHVLLELIINAKEALHERPDPEIVVSTTIEDKDIVAVVADNGEGMTDVLQAKIFDPFFSTKEPKGMGLGLFNAKNIIEGHGGRIKVSTIPNRGTSVTLRLPIDGTVGPQK